MRRSTRRRAALVAAGVLAAATGLVPARPASASISGEAVFFASPNSDQVVVLAGGMRTSVTQFPVTQVLAGHFTADGGAQAFLYNPGPGPDGLLDVERNGEGLKTQFTSAPVGGTFQPFVSDFDRDGRDDIFWYAPGAAKDYVWFFEADGSVTTVPVSVNGSFRPLPVLVDGINAEPDHQGILWYAPGSAPDRWWMFTGRSFSSEPVSINGRYRPVVGSFWSRNYGTSAEQVLFYDPTGGKNALWSFHRGDGNHRSDPVTSPGAGYTPIVTKAGMHGADYVYWYGPGSRQEKVWRFDGSGKVVTNVFPAINRTSRILRDPQGRSAAEELVFLGEGTSASTYQLAPEHAPVFGTVTNINGLPRAPRAASTWFEEPVT